ncbi:MAG: hypothetical protein QXZ17_04875 [Nitrososphaerota archaeon]
MLEEALVSKLCKLVKSVIEPLTFVWLRNLIQKDFTFSRSFGAKVYLKSSFERMDTNQRKLISFVDKYMYPEKEHNKPPIMAISIFLNSRVWFAKEKSGVNTKTDNAFALYLHTTFRKTRVTRSKDKFTARYYGQTKTFKDENVLKQYKQALRDENAADAVILSPIIYKEENLYPILQLYDDSQVIINEALSGRERRLWFYFLHASLIRYQLELYFKLGNFNEIHNILKNLLEDNTILVNLSKKEPRYSSSIFSDRHVPSVKPLVEIFKEMAKLQASKKREEKIHVDFLKASL